MRADVDMNVIGVLPSDSDDLRCPAVESECSVELHPDVHLGNIAAHACHYLELFRLWRSCRLGLSPRRETIETLPLNAGKPVLFPAFAIAEEFSVPMSPSVHQYRTSVGAVAGMRARQPCIRHAAAACDKQHPQTTSGIRGGIAFVYRQISRVK